MPLYKCSNDAIFLIDLPTGNYLDANKSAETLTGKTVTELTTHKKLEVTPKAARKHLEDLLDVNDVFDMGEVEYVRPDGSRRVALLTTIPLSKGHVFGIAHDITERKHAEELLKEEEYKYRILTESMKDVVWTLDPKTLRFIYVSPSVQRLRGFTPEEVIANPIDAVLRPDMLAYLTKQLEANLETYNYTDGENPIYQSNEFEQSCKDGSWVWTEVITNLYHNEKNGQIEILGVSRDISERKKAEQEIQKISQHYQTIIEKAPDGIALLDAGGRFKSVSNSGRKMFGLDQTDVTQINPAENTHPEDLEMVLTELGKIFEDPTYVPTVQYRFGDHKENWKWIETTFSNLLSDPNVESIVLNFRDISERKKAEGLVKIKNEELEKINAEKDKFFSIIAHDLRSPFNGFLGLTQIMAEELADMTLADIQKIATSMRNSASNLFSLLENLLEWSRMQRGLIYFKPELLTLYPLIDDSISIVLEPARSKGIEINILVPKGMQIFADNNMFKTIIRNIVSNAVKFTPRGGKVSVFAKHTNDNCVEICVQDTGIGMNGEMLEDLFKLGLSTSRKGTAGEPSTGLGLFLCKDFVEKHGGKIWTESEEGKGSKFCFSLPLITTAIRQVN